MGRPSKVMSMPRAVRARLDELLIERGFSGYAELSEWLTSQGHAIGKSALHAYGRGLARRVEMVSLATSQAKALVAAAPDDEGAVADAVLRMVQERIFEVLLAAEDGVDLKTLAGAARAVAETARASTSVREERRKALREIADRVRQAEEEEPDAEAAWLRVRREIYGLPEIAA